MELEVDGQRKTGYINRQGQWVIPPQFENGFPFTDNGLARVGVSINGTTKFGYIDRKGEWIIPAKFYRAESFSANELALVQLEEGGKMGYLDTWGEWAIPPKFSNAGIFSANGLAEARLEDNGKWGYIDSKGEWVIKPQFYRTYSFDKNGIAEVKRNEDDYPAFINSKGKVIMQFKDEGDSYQRSNGLFYTYMDDDFVIVNIQGEKIVEKNHDCGTAYINHYGAYLLPRNREEACREFKKNLQELDGIVTELKNSNTHDEVENGNSDSGLVSASIFFEADIGWNFDTVSLETPQGTFIANEGKGESGWNFHVSRATNSIAGKYSYSYTLKSYNGSNYKSCSGSFNVKESGSGYVNIKANSNCNIFVYQN